MKKRKSKFISNRLLYTLITLGILMIVSVGVYAYQTSGTATPSTMGHTANEITFSAGSIPVTAIASPPWITDGNTGWDNSYGYIKSGDSPNFGTVTASSFLYSSDKSLKTNIQQLQNSLKNIKKLNGVSFNWKSSGEKSIGLIAQDVEKVYPEVVSINSDGIKSVDYAKLVAVLIEAVKEQQKQIDELKAQLN